MALASRRGVGMMKSPSCGKQTAPPSIFDEGKSRTRLKRARGQGRGSGTSEGPERAEVPEVVAVGPVGEDGILDGGAEPGLPQGMKLIEPLN